MGHTRLRPHRPHDQRILPHRKRLLRALERLTRKINNPHLKKIQAARNHAGGLFFVWCPVPQPPPENRPGLSYFAISRRLALTLAPRADHTPRSRKLPHSRNVSLRDSRDRLCIARRSVRPVRSVSAKNRVLQHRVLLTRRAILFSAKEEKLFMEGVYSDGTRLE